MSEPRRRRRQAMEQTQLAEQNEPVKEVMGADDADPVVEAPNSNRHEEWTKNSKTIAKKPKKHIAAFIVALACVIALVAGLAGFAVYHSAPFTYQRAQAYLSKGEYQSAAQTFEQLGGYEDSTKLAMYCRAIMQAEMGNYENAISSFQTLGNYKDSPFRIVYYTGMGYEAAGKDEKNSSCNYELLESAVEEYERIPLFLDSAVRAESLSMRIAEIKETLYAEAVVSAENGQYPEAQAIFFRLGDYSDSENRIQYYQIRHIEDGIDCDNPDYLMTVYGLYKEMAGYLDCDGRAQNIQKRANTVVSERYAQVLKLLEEQKYSDAIQILEHFGEYGSEDVERHYYLIAEALIENGSYDAASELYASLGERGYRYASKQVGKPFYVEAEALLDDGKVSEAIAAFTKAGNYSDAGERISKIWYKEAENALRMKKFDEASDMFIKAGNYKDAAERIKEPYYIQAESLIDEGRYDEAVRIFAGLVGYKDALKRSYLLRYSFLNEGRIAAGSVHTVALKPDGSVVAKGWNDYDQCGVSEWSDIIAITAGVFHTVGLKCNGKVIAVGNNEWSQCYVNGWNDTIAIAAGQIHTVGLKNDGTVVAKGKNHYGECEVEDWRNIVAVSTGKFHTVGLKNDGTVVAVGQNFSGQCKVNYWKRIVSVAAGGDHTVGLKSNGTVVATGYNDSNQCQVDGWSDIIAIAAGGSHTVGLKSDGTVVAVGNNGSGQCNVSDWSDIIAIAAGSSHTVGLKSDGTVVAVGNNKMEQCDVSSWRGISGKLTLK